MIRRMRERRQQKRARRPDETRLEYLQNRAKGLVADEVIKAYEVWAEKRRLYYVEDPWLPRPLRRVARAVWTSLAPHFHDEFTALLEEQSGLRQRRRQSIE